ESGGGPAIDFEAEIGHMLAAAVVIDDHLVDNQMGRLVVIGDCAGLGLAVGDCPRTVARGARRVSSDRQAVLDHREVSSVHNHGVLPMVLISVRPERGGGSAVDRTVVVDGYMGDRVVL